MDVLLKVFLDHNGPLFTGCSMAHWMMITSNQILGGISKWYIIAIICYLYNKYT